MRVRNSGKWIIEEIFGRSENIRREERNSDRWLFSKYLKIHKIGEKNRL